MLTEYRKKLESLHRVHGMSRSPLKRKWDPMATLKHADKRLLEVLFPSKKVNVPCTTYKGDLGLKMISRPGVEHLNRSVLRNKYKVRVMASENTELQEYKENVMARVNEGKGMANRNPNLELGPTFAESSSKPPKWRELYEAAQLRNPGETVDREAALLSEKLKALQVTRETWETSAKRKLELKIQDKKRDVADAFTELSAEAEAAVDRALSSRDRKCLVLHEASNIEISGAVIQCLLPRAWLNDEVINLYMELMKEREIREPHRFLRCHFFNSFFYNKLFKDKGRYDYKAVKRWTTQKKLGYSLLDCDKIFVPVHKDIHWCLAIINLRSKKFEYLDSLKGVDEDVLDVLSQYIVDEAKDKLGKTIDVGSWQQEFPDNIPEQQNGCDCGMFMLKYADFHARGDSLPFTQEDMEYFRRRTVWEILCLKAN